MKTLKNLIGFAVLWLMVLWLAGRAPARAEAEAVGRDAWYVVLIAETPVGAVHDTRTELEGSTISLQTMEIALNRLGTTVSMASEVEAREDAAGRLLAIDQELRISSQATHVRAVVEPGRVRIRDQAGEGSFDRELEYEGELLGPHGASELVAAQLQDVGDRVTYKTFRPELSGITEVTLELVARETVTSGGASVEALKLVETLTATPLTTTVWVDADGNLLRSSVASPFGKMEMVATDAASAQLAMSGGELPSESYAATLVPTQVRVREPRSTSRVVLELRHRNPDLGWPELESAHQRVLERSPRRLVLEVRRPRVTERTSYPVESTPELAPYLAPNAYLQSHDPEMRELAVSIAGDSGDALEAGLALERWVAENMRFDMGVVMAPSNEVLSNRRGTCTEYAVLLTTLARALEIPARFVMGYVYAGGIYGGHAWTEIRVGDEWVALDGAIVADGPADAARFAFQWSSLAEGVGALNLGPGVQLFGQIELSVLEVVRSESAVERFDPSAPLFEIEGDRYVNESLGVEWRKPSDFEFAELELSWPETGLVRLVGPEGERVELSVRDRYYWQSGTEAAAEALRRRYPGVEATAVASPVPGALTTVGEDEAMAAWSRGAELWTLRVESSDPRDDLDRLASALRLEP